uniref:WD_REPEATS_REGION domain-containing protein n=1 Tax=Trichobilharzia regenti TaxID=157069 RepID=A0AA85J6M8_TRIRE|nr:unnamed protein product [Trichobilharzia regenti]
MTQSNSVPSPPKRERYAASNTHRHHTLLNMTQKTSSELFKEILSPEILLEKLPNVVENAPEPNCPYKPTCSIREEYGRPIYGVAFNSANRSQPSDPLYFATVSGHYVTVYQCHLKDVVEDASSEDSSRLKPVSTLLTFADPAGDEEEFYCCAWSHDASERSVFNSWGGCSESRRPRPTPHHHQGVNNFRGGSIIPPHQQIIAVAGKRGVIRILCPSMLSCLGSLVGHGGSINELEFHPKGLSLLFSFSKDYTIRLWNVATNVLICVFGGSEGHRAEVLHGDVSLSGNLLLSAGMDHYIKIWRLNTPELANSIRESFNYRLHTNTRLFPVLVQQFPEFSSRDVHGDYVDCARWFGSLVISKSCENCVMVWKPGELDSSSGSSPVVCSESGSGGAVQVLDGLRLPTRLSGIVPYSENQLHTPGVLTDPKASVIHRLKAENCNLWFTRFDLDPKNQILALGTSSGPPRVYLWDLKNPEKAFNLPPKVLRLPPISRVGRGGSSSNHVAIRQIRFANDGEILLCVCDNGVIVRFDRM